MERRFVAFDFEKGRISAYVAVAGNMPIRVMTLDCGSESIIRGTAFDKGSIEEFRLNPTKHGTSSGGNAAAE